ISLAQEHNGIVTTRVYAKHFGQRPNQNEYHHLNDPKLFEKMRRGVYRFKNDNGSTTSANPGDSQPKTQEQRTMQSILQFAESQNNCEFSFDSYYDLHVKDSTPQKKGSVKRAVNKLVKSKQLADCGEGWYELAHIPEKIATAGAA